MDLELFQNEIKESPIPVVVEFWAPWCLPCRTMKPALEKAASRFDSKVRLWRLNADEVPDVLRALKVLGIPTMVAFRDGVEVYRKTGAVPESEIFRFFEGLLQEQQKLTRTPRLAVMDRFLRAGAGFALAAAGIAADFSPILLILAGFLLFSAVYDRCPVYQAISPRIRKYFNRLKNV